MEKLNSISIKAKLWELEQKIKIIKLQAQKALEPIQKEHNELYAELKKQMEEDKKKKERLKKKKPSLDKT